MFFVYLSIFKWKLGLWDHLVALTLVSSFKLIFSFLIYYQKVYCFVRNNTQTGDAGKVRLQCEPTWSPCHGRNALGEPWTGRLTSSAVLCVCLSVCLIIFRLFFVSWCNWKVSLFQKSVMSSVFENLSHSQDTGEWHKHGTSRWRGDEKENIKGVTQWWGWANHRARELETCPKPPCSSLSAVSFSSQRK